MRVVHGCMSPCARKHAALFVYACSIVHGCMYPCAWIHVALGINVVQLHRTCEAKLVPALHHARSLVAKHLVRTRHTEAYCCRQARHKDVSSSQQFVVGGAAGSDHLAQLFHQAEYPHMQADNNVLHPLTHPKRHGSLSFPSHWLECTSR